MNLSLLTTTNPRALLVQSIAAIWLGALLLIMPAYAGRSLVWIFGLFLIIDGGTTLFSRKNEEHNASSDASRVPAILFVVVGALALIFPRLLGKPLLYVFAGWALIHGVMSFKDLLTQGTSKRISLWIGLSAAASIALALLLFTPFAMTLLTKVRWTGIYGLFYGYFLLGLRYEILRAREFDRSRPLTGPPSEKAA